MLGATFGGLTGGLLLVSILFFKQELMDELDKDAQLGKNHELRSFLAKPEAVQYSFIGFTILICVLEMAVAYILFNGARRRDPAKCTLWFRVHCVLFILGIIFTVLAVLSAHEKLTLIVCGAAGLVYQAYSLWVVWAYIKQLRKGIRARQKVVDPVVDEEQAEPLQDMNSKMLESEFEQA